MTTPPRAPDTDKLYDLARIFWRVLRSLTAELYRWSERHYGRSFKEDDQSAKGVDNSS